MRWTKPLVLALMFSLRFTISRLFSASAGSTMLSYGIDFQKRFVHILRQIAWRPWGVHQYLTLSDSGGSGDEERAKIVGRHSCNLTFIFSVLSCKTDYFTTALCSLPTMSWARGLLVTSSRAAAEIGWQRCRWRDKTMLSEYSDIKKIQIPVCHD